MSTITREFSVRYSYSVHFTENTFDPDNRILAECIEAEDGTRPRVVFVVEQGLVTAHAGLLDAIRWYCSHHSGAFGSACEIMTIDGGESCKNDPHVLNSLYDFLDHQRVCRHSYVVAIGGGALLDIVGYAAGTAHRGVRLIRMPTTVLSQDDAGVGVKNSANLFSKKNFLGTFAPPRVVINDYAMLRTLPQRDWIAGVSEAVKVALIKDYGFFEYIEARVEGILYRDFHVMKPLIERCAELHLDHIAYGGDPFEYGSSRPLDFGHWSAHKLESLCGYEIRHGEAVALGIELDTIYSSLIGLLPEHDAERVCRLNTRLGFGPLRIRLTPFLDQPLLERALTEFREHLGGRLHIALLKAIGEKIDVHEIDLDRMQEAVRIVTAGVTVAQEKAA